jgi:hypothetical protein
MTGSHAATSDNSGTRGDVFTHALPPKAPYRGKKGLASEVVKCAYCPWHKARRGLRAAVTARSSCMAVAATIALSLLSLDARAFTIETVATRGCHEEITADALRATKKALPDIVAPLPSVGDDNALIDDVAFAVPGDLHDIGSVTLLLGVRDNDLKNKAAVALDQLAALNGDPAGQKEHCLRLADQDEPGGSSAALDDCRAFIRKTLLSALEGLDPSGRPDGDAREQLDVTLAIRGEIHVSVPVFYLRAGRAIHAIEDSFTHTFRSVADRHKVTVVLNWVDYADDHLDEAVDGPPHMKELDRCDNPDALRAERRRLAVEASAAALRALLDPATATEDKAGAVDAVLDDYLAFDASAHCSADNRWCNAPELAYMPGCGCVLGGRSESSRRPPVMASIAAIFAILFGLRRRRSRGTAFDARRAPRALRAGSMVTALALLMAFPPAAAHASEAAPAPENPGLESPLRALSGRSKAGTPGKEDAVGAFFARVALGASYDKPGFSGGIGARYQFSRPLMFGLDAEWNPFYVPSPVGVRAGVFNAYFSVLRRFQLKEESVNIRVSGGVGASVLLFDLVGAPAGGVGPFFGLSFLGVEWKAMPGFYLTVDPTYIALPVPHLAGAPFAYLQYRFLVGIEFGGV